MYHVSDAELLALVVGALEPSRALELEEVLAAEPALRLRKATLASSMALGEAPRHGWRIPAPGVGMKLRLSASAAPVMGGELRPGDRFRVRVDRTEEPSRRIRVLFRKGEDWEVVYPSAPEEELAVAELPVDADGKRHIDLVAQPPAGHQRWAVALADAGDGVDWDAPETERWAALQSGIAAGSVPGAAVEVEVVAG